MANETSMTKEEAWKVVDHFEGWNKSQKHSNPKVEELIDAKRDLLIKAYEVLAQ